MKTLKFRTNINCDGCVATVTPVLNSIKGIEKWQVDTSVKEKILMVETDEELSTSIVEKVKQSGFEIDPVADSFFKRIF